LAGQISPEAIISSSLTQFVENYFLWVMTLSLCLAMGL
jgi:hypothetical protein